MQHGGPVHAVGGHQDILADDFAVRGPEFGEFRQAAVRLRQVAGEGNVVDQGVKPDVGDEFGVEREFDSPGKAALGAGNAEVRVKVNGVEHFRLAEGRKDKITALFHELLHPFHMVGQAEIPVFFLQFHHFPPFRAEVAFRVPFLIRQELFLAHGVESLVGFFVKLPLVFQVRQDFLYAGLVARIRRGGPSVIADAQAVPQRQELLRDIVDMLLRRNAQLFRRLLHFLPMLVHPGQEIDFLPLHPVPARENVRQDFFISVPDVGRSVGVVNGRGDIVHAWDDTPFLPFCKQSHGGIPGVFFCMGWESKGGPRAKRRKGVCGYSLSTAPQSSPQGTQQEKIRRGWMSPGKFPQYMVPEMNSIAGEREACL